MLPQVTDFVKFDNKLIGFVDKIEKIYDEPYYPFSLISFCILCPNLIGENIRSVHFGMNTFNINYIPRYLQFVSAEKEKNEMR